MTLLTVERIKLFSTRSPWWCMAVAVAVTVGITSIFSVATKQADIHNVTPAATQFPYSFGLVVMMVMATLAITTEYRFGTIRPTFLAVPTRTPALLAKTAVAAGLAGVVGEIAAAGSWVMAKLIKPDAPLALETAQAYRNVFGVGLVYVGGAVIAVAVGLLIRHSAGAIVTLLVWLFLAENLLPVIPNIGKTIQKWLPFVNGDNFIVAGRPAGNTDGPPVLENMPFGPWGSLLYFAAWGAGLLGLGLALARRRDA
jgi:ABC-2 type transport system permease protein